MNYTLAVSETANDADWREIDGRLARWNFAIVGDDAYLPLAIYARDAGGALVGGALGNTYWRWLYISTLWVDESARGAGLGARLLAEAEAIAGRRGCIGVHLDTLDFQALDFYRKQGYALYGQLNDLPPGHTRHYLSKRLDKQT